MLALFRQIMWLKLKFLHKLTIFWSLIQHLCSQPCSLLLLGINQCIWRRELNPTSQKFLLLPEMAKNSLPRFFFLHFAYLALKLTIYFFANNESESYQKAQSSFFLGHEKRIFFSLMIIHYSLIIIIHVLWMLLLEATLSVWAFLGSTCPRVKKVVWDRGSQCNLSQ